MASHQPEVAPALPELDRFLLETKLSIPERRDGSVSRASLIEKVRSSECRIVSIAAPAGYGKSTMMAEWARSDDRAVAWVSLSRLDDDPAILLLLLASAFARTSTDGEALIADMRGSGTSVLGRAAPRLASALKASPQPFVLMLDDLHELRSAGCHDALSVVIAGVPEGSQFVAASRFEQPHIQRLRALKGTVELGAGDLALDAEGATHIFADASVTLSPDAAAEVTDRTEGWPAGLYLAALIARDNPGAEPVHGDDRFVADYLYAESLAGLPEDTQQFLRRTAVLDQMSAPLCDAVLRTSSGQAHLRQLEETNSFLVPLDRRRGWFRYHALYREFLLSELRRIEPGEAEEIHLRAADWYEAHNSQALALEHLLNTDERERSVQLVTQLVLPTYAAGQLSVVQRWLSTLGDSAIAEYPPLAVLAAWISALSGQTAEAQRWVAIADAGSFDLPTLDGTASIDSARAMIRAVMCASGPEQMMADATLAVSQEPPWSPWRAVALVMLGEALLLGGDETAAYAAFSDASAAGAAVGGTDTIVVGEAEIALIEMDRGNWSTAAKHVAAALDVIDTYRMHDYATCLVGLAAAARLAVHNGDRVNADLQVARAMRARPVCTYVLPTFAIRARLQLAKVHLARGDVSTAWHLSREIDEVMHDRPAMGVLATQVSELHEILSSAETSAVTGASPLSGAELRLLPYLQTHLTITEIGERLFVSRNTVSTQVASIYRKLGVSKRSHAVQRATQMGLLGG